MQKIEQNVEQKSPKIELPDDLGVVKNLQAKLKEYKQRLAQEEGNIDPYHAPEQNFQKTADTKYKIAVCESLLLNGVVDAHELSRALAQQDGMIDTRAYENACGVIEDYISTGGENSHGGTGFGNEDQESKNLIKIQEEQKAKDAMELAKLRGGVDENDAGLDNKGNEEGSSKEKVKGKIESLGEKQKDLFVSRMKVHEGLYELSSLKNSGKISEETRKELFDIFIRPIVKDEVNLREEIGEEAVREFGKLELEYLQSETEEGVKKAENFEGLFKFLNRLNRYSTSHGNISVDELKSVITKVRTGHLGVNYITRNYGLRDKVKELMYLESRK